MDKLRNIDFGLYDLDNINFVNYHKNISLIKNLIFKFLNQRIYKIYIFFLVDISV